MIARSAFAAAMLILGDWWGVVSATEQGGASVGCAGVESSLDSAHTLIDEGRWSEAAEVVEPVSLSHPKCSDAILALARIEAARNQTAAAERLFAEAMLLAPEDARAHAVFAGFQLSRGLRPQAANLAGFALSIDPNCGEALVVRARILLSEGRIADARRDLERAVAVDPDNAVARYQLGVWFFQIHRFDVAAAHFRTAGERDSLQTRTWDHLGVAYEMLGDARSAEEAYERAVENNRGPFPDPYLDYNYGRFLVKQGRFTEGKERLDRAVGAFPHHRGIRYERAKLLVALDDYEAARVDAERALSLDDSAGRILDVQLYYLLTTIYTRLGETELAGEYADLTRAAEIPENSPGDRR